MTLGAALVTGAARGIGRAITLRLAKDGYSVALCDIGHRDQLASLRSEIAALGQNSFECMADVSKEADVRDAVNRTVTELGGLDVMVANAGIYYPMPLIEGAERFCIPRPTDLTAFTATLQDWDAHFNVNGKGVFLCYKYAALAMIQQGRGGRIIGASSLAGKQGVTNLDLSIYSATKFTVRALTQAAVWTIQSTLAQELKPHGITVNAYAPGLIATDMSKEFIKEAQARGDTDTLRRSGNPEDIAGLVSYLASPESRFITGQSISINGGIFCD
ncbi:hypothetical protein D9756_009483 [Leucocoprinus leucothites]|uniref:Uncharacterized protein n=1 Tax=Leucocoprinus leucothites TaxID=201217 RepID=A0A8H5FU78_9AGAR|nr:hypothetical protein D9756_009483 [Leucoagaricus leucothites]